MRAKRKFTPEEKLEILREAEQEGLEKNMVGKLTVSLNMALLELPMQY